MRAAGKWILVKFSKHDVENANKVGSFYLTNKQDGSLALIEATIFSVGENCTTVTNADIGKRVVLRHGIGYDVWTNKEGFKKNQWFIDYDEDEGHIRYCAEKDLYATIENGEAIPFEGRILCRPLDYSFEGIKNKIFILGDRQDTATKGFQTDVIAISPKDKELLGVKEKSVVLCDKNADNEVTIKSIGKTYLVVESRLVMAEILFTKIKKKVIRPIAAKNHSGV